MKKNLFYLFVMAFLSVLSVSGNVFAQETVTIDTSKQGENISPYIYGQFIEHLGRCINGGIWAEMFEDRKFYHAVGEKESPWFVFGDGVVTMNEKDAFVGKHSPELMLEQSDGYAAIAQKRIAVVKNKTYKGYIWLKCDGDVKSINVFVDYMLARGNITLRPMSIPVNKGDYYKHEFEFESPQDHYNCQLTISANGKGSVLIGTISLMPSDNIQGMRADTLALLKELDSPVYRWPGGNFVSGYDWNDGIGDRDRRPPRKNPAWSGVEHNDFGLDEFMAFCKYLGTEPYIAVNTGNGEVDNAVAELEYANGSIDTPQGKRRAENGHAEPYAVKFWGIGNEMYGDWQIGHMSTEEYAKKHNLFAEAFQKNDSNVILVAVGAIGKWDETIMRQCADHMNLISEHFYVGDGGPERSVVEHVNTVPNAIKNIANAHRKYREEFPELKGKDIKIAMDEWNYWYGPHVFGELGTRYFVKDGLGIAAGLHEYFRNSDIYYMANYAQTVNVIGCIKTSKTNAQFETTGLVLKLYRNEFGTIPVAVESPKPFDVAAALTDDGKTLTVGIINPTDKEVSLQMLIKGLKVTDQNKRFEIVGKNPMDYNDPTQPQKIDIVESNVKSDGNGPVSVAPYSVTLLKFSVSTP